MKHSKIDSRNFKKKKWKNTEDNQSNKTNFTIEDMEKK